MIYRVGLYDPAFRLEGHFVSFNRYLVELMATDNIEVVLLDTHGDMARAYGTSLPASYQMLPQAIPSKVPGVLGRVLSRYFYWKKTYRSFKENGLDLVIYTADPRDILMCYITQSIPYGTIIMYPYSYVDRKQRGLMGWVNGYIYKRFVSRAAIRITTNEPPLKKDIEKALSVTDIQWIPDMPTYFSPQSHKEKDIPFLTIGTISRSKNHLFAINSFEAAQLPYTYVIAGKPLDEVGMEVKRRVESSRYSLQGNFTYLDDTSYKSYFERAQFLLFPYDFTRGNISSQVLHDAFSFELPFIAPAIQPFKWYVEKYGIGLLYEEGNDKAFADALTLAMERGPEEFQKGFGQIRQIHSLACIKQSFLPKLYECLEKGRQESPALSVPRYTKQDSDA